MLQVIELSATGDAFDKGTTGTFGLAWARLQAAAANATAVIRETDGSGRVLARLSCVPNTDTELQLPRPIAYQGKVHVTLAGAGATIQLGQ